MVHITVKRIHAVARWKWIGSTIDSVCAICNSSLENTCTSCMRPGNGCPPAFGKCGHHFHLHCMEKWIKQNKLTCPCCRADWYYETQQLN
ncbi:anaphase promoting complex subunit, putative [Plasmodium sp. DRC-Itaito]|nr:anaphase promoting complex subunit, putative [Plasmodium sp. DRC-Itaito]